jgi:hypothetical protein
MELYSQRPQCAANVRGIIKQYYNGNNEELDFKNDVREQDQAKPKSQRNVKSVKSIRGVLRNFVRGGFNKFS